MRRTGQAPALTLALALILFGGPALFARPAAAQAFSADLVTANAPGQPAVIMGRLNVDHGVVRLETSDLRDGHFVVDLGAGTALFVMPAQRIFMDARQSSRPARIFVPVDPDNPCRAWQAMAKITGAAGEGGGRWHCERTGISRIGARKVLDYRVVSPRGAEDSAAIDPGLRFPIKFASANGVVITLDHIRMGAQPAALFAIPADYRKFDPQQLIERIKESDVWVAPPK